MVVDSPAGLEEFREPWQRLAEAASAPYCQPAWQLAWWRHAAPSGAELRAVVVQDGPELIGLAPFFCDPAAGIREYRLLAAPICAEVKPLAVPGREGEVATALSAAMAGVSPKAAALTLIRQPHDSPWPELLADTWPGKRPAVLTRADNVTPTLDLSGRRDEDFVASLSKNLRSNVRRGRRSLEGDGVTVAPVPVEQAQAHLEDLARLHPQRMGEVESGAMLPGVDQMLVEAAEEMMPAGTYRLWAAALPDDRISVFLFVACGGAVSYWLGAIDDEWAKHRPGVVTLVAAVEEAIERGDSSFEFGPGLQDYKVRLADGERALETTTLLPRGKGYAMTRLRLAPVGLKRAVGARVRRLRGSS
jgi:CelD/BcsL family acetyltransferase involved in cellulose biosynthesis